MKIDQYCQQQRCEHVELEQFWHAFASHGFVSDSWAFLLSKIAELSLILFLDILDICSYQPSGICVVFPFCTQLATGRQLFIAHYVQLECVMF